MENDIRRKSVTRTTKETEITAILNIDGSGESGIDTGIGFLDHMLISLAKHGGFDLVVKCKGDLYVDGHHTAEDIGIVVGQVFAKCMENKSGIRRYGTAFTPMDEALAEVSVDISGRPYLVYQVECQTERVGDFDVELAEELFRAFAYHGMITLHIHLKYGKNTHHILEAIFKSVGRALKEAVQVQGEELPSTKGMI